LTAASATPSSPENQTRRFSPFGTICPKTSFHFSGSRSTGGGGARFRQPSISLEPKKAENRTGSVYRLLSMKQEKPAAEVTIGQAADLLS
jgi:hypothetical protein